MSADASSAHEIRLPGLDRELGRLDSLVREIAAAWVPRMQAATTIGRERALLRLLGVSGLDASGLPLAGSVVDRSLAGSRDRLADGVSLAFATALVEYDIGPQQLALDVATGLIDLAKEAELLVDPEQRRRAEAALAGLVAGAFERIDANRTARRELCAVLGEPPPPWISTLIGDPDSGRAAAEARLLARAGFDVLQVQVPMGREWSGLLEAAGLETDAWRTQITGGAGRTNDGTRAGQREEPAPAGSQRGLAAIRAAVDEVAATRRGYIRLASAAPPLAAPEQAVVAAFERVDIVVADVMTEIVASGVDPDRALADHAFAAAIHRRAGSTLLVGPGPLVVGPDLAAGQPSDAATRSGRALALQLLGVHLARAAGVPPAQVIVGAVPPFLTAERSGPAFALAEVAMRRRLLPEHTLQFTADGEESGSDAAALVRIAGIAPGDGATALLYLNPDGAVAVARSALATGVLLARSRAGVELDGAGLDHARGTIGAAIRALDGLAGDGWRSILGEGFDDPEHRRYGADAVTERTDANDPLRDLA